MKSYNIIIALLLTMFSMTMKAQEKQMVVYHSNGTTTRIDITAIDSVCFENAIYDTHEAIDLGLSVKWAACNIGATQASDYGNYFAWGETSPKNTYTEENYTVGNDCMNPAKNLLSDYDAAHATWGFNWRMPTIAEIDELSSRCTWTWTAQNGVSGYRITGPSGNSIFLPAAGQMRDKAVNVGSTGYYWSATLSNDYSTAAYNLNFTGYTGRWSANRSYGFTIRAVTP